MLKHKNKFIIGGVILAVLAIAWFWGTNPFPPPIKSVPAAIPTGVVAEVTEPAEETAQPIETLEETQKPKSAEKAPAPPPNAAATPKTETPAKTDPPKQETNPSAGKDKYQTDPVPEGKPLPVEPENVTVGSTANTCTLSVRCDTLVGNSKLDKEKVELVPADGVIFKTTTVTFYEGESVFNVLQREMKRNKIHMAFRNTPIYNSAYIEAINNLYEFDGGDLSGWMYKVNGWFPNYGCSRYQLKPGDVIEWVYTCDLGRDVGGFYATGGGS